MIGAAQQRRQCRGQHERKVEQQERQCLAVAIQVECIVDATVEHVVEHEVHGVQAWQQVARHAGRLPVRELPGHHVRGDLIDEHTLKEQLLYEVHDPAAYVTPDVVADISEAEVAQIGADRVRVGGVRGHPRTGTLKVNVCFESGWLAEGEISYAGARAEARARLAADVLRERLRECGPLRADLIGVSSLFGDDAGRWLDALPAGSARDVRLRVALRHEERAVAERLVREVTALYTCGPAGGGGVRTALKPTLGTLSCLLPRELITATYEMLE